MKDSALVDEPILTSLALVLPASTTEEVDDYTKNTKSKTK
jgi:hypothetical protein